MDGYSFIPIIIQVVLLAGVAWAVTNGLKGLSEHLHRDLTGWSTLTVLAITAGILAALNTIVAGLPPTPQIIAVAFLQFLAIALTAMGYKRVEVKVLGHTETEASPR